MGRVGCIVVVPAWRPVRSCKGTTGRDMPDEIPRVLSVRCNQSLSFQRSARPSFMLSQHFSQFNLLCSWPNWLSAFPWELPTLSCVACPSHKPHASSYDNPKHILVSMPLSHPETLPALHAHHSEPNSPLPPHLTSLNAPIPTNTALIPNTPNLLAPTPNRLPLLRISISLSLSCFVPEYHV